MRVLGDIAKIAITGRITENCSKWKRLFDSELERNGGEAILKGNLNKKDVNNLKISDPFVKEILVIWSEVFFQETIVSEEHLLSSPLWQNSLIRIQNKPVFFIKTGLLRVLRKLNI